MTFSKLIPMVATASLVKQATSQECPFGYTASPSVGSGRNLQAVTYPSEILTGDNCILTTPSTFTTNDYDDIVTDVNALYDAVDATVSDNYNPRSNFAGCLIRLAGHDLMDYRTDSDDQGGADGCINFDDADNTGLATCLDNSGIQSVYANWCGIVSLADFVIIAAEAVTGKTAADPTFAATLKNQFKFGRTTHETCAYNEGRLPNPELGCGHLSDIFIDHIYAGQNEAWALTAALSGAHTIGSAKIENSGYEGFWSDAANSGIFNNDYFTSILVKGWGPELSVAGNDDKNQWIRVDLGANAAHKEFMLTSDMCLAFENVMIPEQQNCCAWVSTRGLGLMGREIEELDYCGVTSFGNGQRAGRRECCAGERRDCDNQDAPEGVAYAAVLKFMEEENVWLDYYALAWKIGIENGWSGLISLGQDTADDSTETEVVVQETTVSITDCSTIHISQECKLNDLCSWEKKSKRDMKKNKHGKNHCVNAN